MYGMVNCHIVKYLFYFWTNFFFSNVDPNVKFSFKLVKGKSQKKLLCVTVLVVWGFRILLIWVFVCHIWLLQIIEKSLKHTQEDGCDIVPCIKHGFQTIWTVLVPVSLWTGNQCQCHHTQDSSFQKKKPIMQQVFLPLMYCNMKDRSRDLEVVYFEFG